jgi:hypothetical protein
VTARQLVEALLETSGHYLTVFGPKVPETGLVVRTDDGRDPFGPMFQKYSHVLPVREGTPTTHQAEDLIYKGYIFILSSPELAGITVFSKAVCQKMPDGAIDVLQRVYGVRPSTPVRWGKHIDGDLQDTFANVAVYGEKPD